MLDSFSHMREPEQDEHVGAEAERLDVRPAAIALLGIIGIAAALSSERQLT
jgi:hypothetical protein